MRSLIACPVVDCIGTQLPVTKVLFTFLCTVPTVSQAFVSPFSLDNNIQKKGAQIDQKTVFLDNFPIIVPPNDQAPEPTLKAIIQAIADVYGLYYGHLPRTRKGPTILPVDPDMEVFPCRFVFHRGSHS